MASLIVAAGMLAHGKIKDRKEAKKEKKRKAYETRYNELEAEQKTHQEQSLSRQKTQENNELEKNSDGAVRRNSSESHRSQRRDSEDGPGRWVEAALKKRQTSQSMG